MKIKLVSIGNSKGIRIPRAIIEQCGLGDQVEMRVADGQVVLAPARATRQGWDTAFANMAAAGGDAPLLPEHLDQDWDTVEWTW